MRDILFTALLDVLSLGLGAATSASLGPQRNPRKTDLGRQEATSLCRV
jgi:hypothetical protein